MVNALIVVDVQNDFMPNGALPVPNGNEVISIINGIVNMFDYVVFTQDWHPENHCSFKENGGLWPKHCVKESHGASFPPTLNCAFNRLKKGTRVHVDSYSAFFDNDHNRSTRLNERLENRKIEQVFICGVATEYCVKYTVLDALKFYKKVYVIADACRGITNEGVTKAMDEMKSNGGELIPSTKIPSLL